MCRLPEARARGAVAQLVERYVRNVEVRGSTPLGSTNNSLIFKNLPGAGWREFGRQIPHRYAAGGLVVPRSAAPRLPRPR